MRGAGVRPRSLRDRSGWMRVCRVVDFLPCRLWATGRGKEVSRLTCFGVTGGVDYRGGGGECRGRCLGCGRRVVSWEKGFVVARGMGRIAVPDLPKRLEPVGDRVFESEVDWWRLEVGRDGCAGVRAAGFEMEQCRFVGTDLSSGAWQNGVWRDCRLESVSLAGVVGQRCSLLRSQVMGARATGLQWTDGVVKDVSFSDCRIDLAGFRFTRFSHVEFVGCRMAEVDFTGADVSGVRFVDCDLQGAKLHEAKAVGARFEGCRLEEVSGVEALAGATISAADVLPLAYTLAGALGISLEFDRLLDDGEEHGGIGDGGEAVPFGWDDQEVAGVAGHGVVAGVEAYRSGEDLKC